MSANQITLGERLVTGFLSAVVMAIMTICVPIGMVILSRGHGLNMLIMFGSFHIWGLSLIVVSGIVGTILGTDRTMIIFGHLWGTELPKKPGITLLLWATLVGIAATSYWVFTSHHSL